ncbi:MAG: OmpA family protein [Nitrospira sp.]|nr:OmpA family protein [Nitrospira sp.]MCP9441840.1 OmpA family protein [Nitrospira sp.]
MMKKMVTTCALLLPLGLNLCLDDAFAQIQDPRVVRYGEAAITFASGAIQKVTPRDGIVNLITGDNQSSGNRMLLGTRDVLYLKLDNPATAAVGDLFTVYRRVRKVFHPLTREYLGSVTIRLAVVKVTDIEHELTTAETVVGYGPIAPGDLVMRFVAPPVGEVGSVGSEDRSADIEGMIVEIQADKPMTMVSQWNVVYVDRGSADGLKVGDVLDLHRHSVGLPVRKIGQIKVLSTEDHTATARVIKATTRVYKGDRVKRIGSREPMVQSWGTAFSPATAPKEETAPTDLITKQLTTRKASGESRINLGDLSNVLYYESGQATIQPEGHHVLDQLIAYLSNSGDSRLIRVEGHTDNVEIGPSLRARYASNVELSNARADSVVRYLIERGGLDPARLTAVGYGDGRPTATNANEQGRSKNRRVEIVLYEPTPSALPGNNASRQMQNQSAPLNVQSEKRTENPASDFVQETGSGTFSVHDQTFRATSPEYSATLDSLDAPDVTRSESNHPSQAAPGDGPPSPGDSLRNDPSPQGIGDQANNPDSSGS